jgi:hypothetical protein
VSEHRSDARAHAVRRLPAPSPTRLWYRIHARSSASVLRESPPGDRFVREEREAGYRLKANAATIVTVSCDGPNLSAPGRRCRDVGRIVRSRFPRQRRLLLRGIRESLSFKAN